MRGAAGWRVRGQGAPRMREVIVAWVYGRGCLVMTSPVAVGLGPPWCRCRAGLGRCRPSTTGCARCGWRRCGPGRWPGGSTRWGWGGDLAWPGRSGDAADADLAPVVVTPAAQRVRAQGAGVGGADAVIIKPGTRHAISHHPGQPCTVIAVLASPDAQIGATK